MSRLRELNVFWSSTMKIYFIQESYNKGLKVKNSIYQFRCYFMNYCKLGRDHVNRFLHLHSQQMCIHHLFHPCLVSPRTFLLTVPDLQVMCTFRMMPHCMMINPLICTSALLSLCGYLTISVDGIM